MALITAKTTYGTVKGIVLENCTVFRGICYAKARRFMPPEQPVSWQGVRVCGQFSPICPQNQITASTPFGDFFVKEFYPEQKLMSEDSLCLNIWTSADSSQQRQPVMVWFHGGGMSAGYGHEIEFDGECIARREVILVTINYRLGCLGYFTHPEISQNIAGGTANNAIRDQQAALRWIQDNISEFGGDPDNVTIFGQSAGGGSVVSHLCSPLSDGLFHRGIIQSGFGGINEYGRLTSQDTEKWSIACCEYLGKSAAELSTMPINELLAAFKTAEHYLGGIPKQVEDGFLFMEPPGKMIQRGSPKQVSLMVGSVAGDAIYPSHSNESLQMQELRRRFGLRADDFVKKYPLTDKQNKSIYEALERSRAWFQPLCFCMVQSKRTNCAYMYHFCPSVPGRNESGFVPDGEAFHSSELWYVFGTLNRCWRHFDWRHDVLSNSMIGYWTNFARSGNPNGPGLPEWHAYSIDNQEKKYATLVMTENEISVQQLVDDDVWKLAAFKLFEESE